MSKFTFRGGIHLQDGKELSKDKPIITIMPKGDLVYPLSQHIGAPACPVVKKGDHVLAGMKIAEANGFVSAHIFSSVSGTVKGIEPRRVPCGDMIESIVIENDGCYEEMEYHTPNPLQELDREEIISLIREAGIVGMGGAGFPTHVKLSPKEPEAIRYVIANCAECEPYLTSDYRRMMEEPEKLVEGLKVVLALFKNARGILAVEDNKPECIKKLKEIIRDEKRIEVRVLQTKYPQGAERQLIYAVTGKAIHSGMLPAEAHCIVDNVDTLVAVYNAVVFGKPLMQRIVTVTGDAIKNPVNILARCGINYAELIEEAGGYITEPQKIISGGPMMGFALFDPNVPVTKISSALICMSKDQVEQYKPSACINCGRCAEVCPSRLVPARLARSAVNDNMEMFVKQNGMECVECGNCSYVCPAKQYLAQSIKSMRRIQLGNIAKEKMKEKEV